MCCSQHLKPSSLRHMSMHFEVGCHHPCASFSLVFNPFHCPISPAIVTSLDPKTWQSSWQAGAQTAWAAAIDQVISITTTATESTASTGSRGVTRLLSVLPPMRLLRLQRVPLKHMTRLALVHLTRLSAIRATVLLNVGHCFQVWTMVVWYC